VADLEDADLWRSVERTVRNVLLPALDSEWARISAVQLIGMARYAAARPDDPGPERARELADLLDGLSANPIVAAQWPQRTTEPAAVAQSVGRVLADAVGRDDAAGDEVRAVLRPVVVRQLDDELAVTGVMVPYFRGAMPDA
jgi:hypothetical protein